MSLQLWNMGMSTILGAVIGSFLNVVIYRLPAGESLSYPPSQCPGCHHRLKWYQLIPIFSYFKQRGRCAQCDSKISIQYPLIELITAGAFLWLYIMFGYQWLTLVYWILLASLIALTLIDWRHYIIPDEINGVIFITGLLASIFGVTIPLHDAALGSLLGGGVLLILALVSRGGMGGGDIKLLSALGLFTGWQLMFLLLFLSSLLGSVFGLGNIIIKGREKGRLIPFGPFLAVAAIIVLIWGHDLIGLYWSFF